MQPQQRIYPGGYRQAQAGPGVPQHEVKPVQHCRVGEYMQVVDNQHHRRVLRSQRRRKPQQEPSQQVLVKLGPGRDGGMA